MRKRSIQLIATALLAALLAPAAIAAANQAAPAQAKQPPPPPKIKVGDAAPDFTLLAFDGAGVTPVALHDYRGKKNVALAFYVFAFTGG